MTDHRLGAALRLALHQQPHGALCVAFSGGPDSSAMLHALAQLPQARERGLRALHVDHGLHADSASWAEHCHHFCAALDVPCASQRVQVDRKAGIGLEAAAREARYAVFAQQLELGERLLFAHHQDDQIETVLLKLLRGAGPEGLGGMRAQRPLGDGLLWRPLLELPRAVLRDYVQAHALDCIHDPSNDNQQLARNRLRHDVLPRLQSLWPQASASIVQSARLCRDAADSLRIQWQAALQNLRDPADDSLDARAWLTLAPALREPLLAEWLHQRGLSAPTTAQRRQLERQIDAAEGQQPCVHWSGTEVYVWKQRLWARARQAPPPADAHWMWQGEPLQLGPYGQLWLEPDARLLLPLEVRFRRGGERLRPAGAAYTRELRKLFQDGAVPPWQRDSMPLLYANDELIAVGNRWLSERAQAIFNDANAQIGWRSSDDFGIPD